MATRLHERLQHEQLEDKQIRRNPKPNVQSVIILCKTSQVGKEENRVKTALGGACAALGGQLGRANLSHFLIDRLLALQAKLRAPSRGHVRLLKPSLGKLGLAKLVAAQPGRAVSRYGQ